MTCDKAVQSYLENDNGMILPIGLRLHMLHCKRCRRYLPEMGEFFASLRDDSAFDMPVDIVDSVMTFVRSSNVKYDHRVSIVKWTIGGVMLFSSVFLISFSESFQWLADYFGGILEIPLRIVLGLSVSLYAAGFIAAHIEELKGYIENLPWRD